MIRIEGLGLELAVEKVPADAVAGTYLRLRVWDNGPGMDEDTRKRIFEPFFTTKDVDKGTGLGLSTALGIVQEHDGWIECDSAPGSGACFDLFLPVADGVDITQKSPAVMHNAQGTETILVIDDEEMVRYTAMQMLNRRGFKTHAAADGAEGLELFRQRETTSASYCLIIPCLACPVWKPCVSCGSWRLICPSLSSPDFQPILKTSKGQMICCRNRSPSTAWSIGSARL